MQTLWHFLKIQQIILSVYIYEFMEVFFDNLIYNVIQSHHMFRDDGQHY